MGLKHRPVYDRIQAKKRPISQTAEIPLIAGLYQPSHRPTAHHYADVLAVGPGPFIRNGVQVDAPCLPGDCIQVRELAGESFTEDGQEYFIFIPDEVIQVVA